MKTRSESQGLGGRRRLFASGIESLERRDLLAADLLPGDANRDYHLDESDFVFAMKAGKYETGDDAEWAEGDWNDDGLFNSSDHLLVFTSGQYRSGPYSDSAGDPVSDLKPLSNGERGDVTLYYDSTNGNLRVGTIGSDALVTTIQIRSASNQFTEDPGNGLAGLFDVDFSTDTRSFFGPSGYDSYVFRGALPIDMPLDALRSDLTVDGSLFGGGELGAVRLISESPARDGHLPGDSNRDYYFDPSDFVQVMRVWGNHQEIPGRTYWETGDWNGDGSFNSSDFVVAFSSGNYGQGAYDVRAGEAQHQLKSPVVGADDAPLTIYYDSADGSIVAVPSDFMTMTTLHIRSRSGALQEVSVPGLFDVSDETDFFRLSPDGESQVAARTLPGLTLEEIAADLAVDGSRNLGGGIETVAVSSIRELPSEHHVDMPSCQDSLLEGLLPGDANRDGIFNSQDLTQVFATAEYDDGIPDNSVWGEGDWNCDGEFDSGDLVRAFASGYSRDSVAAAWVGGRLGAGEGWAERDDDQSSGQSSSNRGRAFMA